MKTIALIGFMGSGKTTVGEALAKKLEIPFSDMDIRIEDHFQKSIPTIFKTCGETSFRDIEHQILIQSPIENLILATGGGVVEYRTNREWLIQNVNTVFLNTSFETVINRLKHDQSRPNWSGSMAERRQLFERRQSLYREASHYSVSTEGYSIDEIVEKIITHYHL